MKLFLLGIFFGTGLLNTSPNESWTNHAIYVSVLEIEKEQYNDTGTIMVKIFGNDLEDAIFNHAQKRIDLISGECDEGKSLVSSYFNNHLKFIIDGKEQSYSYLSCEVNDISLWITFEFASKDTWKEVIISADYLMELFPTQSNVVSITYRKEKKMFRLTKEATTEAVSF